MYEYRHNVMWGRIVVENDEMRAFVSKLDGLFRSLPTEDNFDSFKKLQLKNGVLEVEPKFRYYEFFVDVSGRGMKWNFEFINKVFQSFVDGDKHLHPLTYVVSVCDSTDKQECSCRAYGNVKVEYLPYSRETAKSLFKTNNISFTSIGKIDVRITMPHEKWVSVFGCDDYENKIKILQNKDDKYSPILADLSQKLYDAFGVSVCPENEDPQKTISNLSFLDIRAVSCINSDDVTICLTPSDTMTKDPDALMAAQKHATEIMKPQYDGIIRYEFWSNSDGILLPNLEIGDRCSAFVQYLRDERNQITDAQILHFSALDINDYMKERASA